MTEPGITEQEIERLEAVKKHYIERRHSFMVITITFSAAFPLATLSSIKIPDEVNLWITIFVLCCLVCALLWSKLTKNPLASSIRDLEQKYPNHAETRRLLDRQNIWKGFHEEKFTLWFSILLSVLFIFYAGIEHALRAL